MQAVANTGAVHAYQEAAKSAGQLYQAIIPKGAVLDKLRAMEGAVRGSYRDVASSIKGNANWVAVDGKAANNLAAVGVAMCGILIYTASSDSDGSLGGLARQGVTEKIRDTLFSMLENSSWCSNDPVCIDSTGQGYSALNYAACHACTLLPETSCECSNMLLDRGALIGTSDDPQLGFFSDMLF